VVAAWIAAMLANKSFALGDAVEYENLKIAFVWMGFAIMAVILSWRVDINAFSTHLLYRNRLVRCYLGASVTNRQAQPFTGFSAEDDVPLSSLRIPLTDADPALAARPILLFQCQPERDARERAGAADQKGALLRFYAALLGLHAPVPGSSEWQAAFARRHRPACKNRARRTA